ncbi:MAG: hypothetical protein ACQERN_09675 [Thermodesulfobacteriota bacterium]
MKLLTSRPFVCLFCFAMLCFFLLCPLTGRALKPLDDQALLDSSPSTIEKLDKVPIEEQLRFESNEFSESICFKKCHQPADFSPAEKTRKQWRLLIGEDGHAIFKEINWESTRQKQRVMQYLLENAKNANADAEGIGVWH